MSGRYTAAIRNLTSGKPEEVRRDLSIGRDPALVPADDRLTKEDFYAQFNRMRDEKRCMFFYEGALCSKAGAYCGSGISYLCAEHKRHVANITRLIKFKECMVAAYSGSGCVEERQVREQVVRLRNLINIHVVPDYGHIRAAQYWQPNANCMYLTANGKYVIVDAKTDQVTECSYPDRQHLPQADIIQLSIAIETTFAKLMAIPV